MSTIKVNTIENRTGSSITIGGSSTTSLDLASTITGGTLTNGPSFLATLSASQTGLTSGAATKIQYNSEVYDTDGCYDNATNYRFTPTTAGKYYVYASALVGNGSFTVSIMQKIYLYIYKNGSRYHDNELAPQNSNVQYLHPYTGTVITLNGTTDYVEIYVAPTSSDSSTCQVYGNSAREYRIFGAYRLIGL